VPEPYFSGSLEAPLGNTARLAEAGIAPSIGAAGDAYDAMAESTIGLFKTELISR